MVGGGRLSYFMLFLEQVGGQQRQLGLLNHGEEWELTLLNHWL